MSPAALGAAAVAGIALPHVLQLRLRRPDPATACLLWSAALALRALLVIGAVAGALVMLHPAHLLDALASWGCAPRHRVAGHMVAALSGVVLVGSVLYALARIAHASAAAGRLAREPLGRGPQGSLIVGGEQVMLAVAGLRRPQLLVSAGALAHLDDAELLAALAHERAHIVRRHRFALLFGEMCRVIARPLPGTASAARALRLHIERDADRAATIGREERLALASAICKAGAPPARAPLTVLLGSEGAATRVRELLEVGETSAPRRLARAGASLVVLCVLAAAIALPGVLGSLGEPAALCPI